MTKNEQFGNKKKAEKARYKEKMHTLQSEQKERAKAEKQKFLKEIGISTRLMMVRRGFTAFIAAMLLEIGLGSLVFSAVNSENRRSYIGALKSVYNITNLTDGDKWTRKDNEFSADAVETLIATLMMMVALEYARRGMKRDRKIAQDTLYEMIKYPNNKRPEFRMIGLYYIKNKEFYIPASKEISWKLHPVSRQIIKHIIANNPTIFNELISGQVRRASRDYTMTVIKAHLKLHPEDFPKVLGAYEMETLPKSLTRKYCQHVH